MNAARHWLRLAARPSVMRRALRTAALIGSLLIVINHGDALLHGQVDALRALKMGLTVMVPYLVSTSSSVAALRELGHG